MINLRTLRPIFDAIAKSIRKTSHRLVLVEYDCSQGGIGSEICGSHGRKYILQA